MIYPPTRERTIAQLSESKTKGPADIDLSTLQAYVHYASEEYDKSFRQGSVHDQRWWDGALAMARWILEAEGQ